MKTILPIVEGDGDVRAVPELVRRIAYEAGHYDLRVLTPHRRGDLSKIEKRFEDFLQTALLEEAPVLWVVDYDCSSCDDVERDLQELQARANLAGSQVPVAFALMVKEFESLFLADQETTRGFFPDIPANVIWPADPETVRDAKGFLSNARPRGLAYKETVHQEKLAAQLSLPRLRDRSSSFVRFEAAVLSLLQAEKSS